MRWAGGLFLLWFQRLERRKRRLVGPLRLEAEVFDAFTCAAGIKVDRKAQRLDDQVGEIGLGAIEMVGKIIAFKINEDFGIGGRSEGLFAARQEDAVDRLGDAAASPVRA